MHKKAASGLATLPWGTSVDEVMAIMDDDGGLILSGALTSEEVGQINAELDAALEARRSGSHSANEELREFWGHSTKRITNVVTLSRTYRERFLSNPLTHAYVGRMFEGVSETFWLNTAQVIEIQPGEKAQILHRDMGNYPVFFRYGADAPEVMVNMIVPLIDTVEENGATRVIPGSHKWDFERSFSDEMTVPAEMKAGSCLFYSGKLVHGGGANLTDNVRRRVITSPFNPGFLVPEEAYPFAVPIEVARGMTPQLQQMIGFRSFYQTDPRGGPLWQHDYEELANYLGL